MHVSGSKVVSLFRKQAQNVDLAVALTQDNRPHDAGVLLGEIGHGPCWSATAQPVDGMHAKYAAWIM